MKIPSTRQIDAFINALQLSIESQIVSYQHNTANNELRVHLDKKVIDDKKLEIFRKIGVIVGLNYKTIHICLDPEQMEALTNFLLLTRLDYVSLKFLAEAKDESIPSFIRENIEKIYSPKGQETISMQNLTDASQFIFGVLREKKMTMRELSALTGFTQASLHHFKNSQDIKLSNFIKIARALGLRIKLTS